MMECVKALLLLAAAVVATYMNSGGSATVAAAASTPNPQDLYNDYVYHSNQSVAGGDGDGDSPLAAEPHEENTTTYTEFENYNPFGKSAPPPVDTPQMTSDKGDDPADAPPPDEADNPTNTAPPSLPYEDQDYIRRSITKLEAETNSATLSNILNKFVGFASERLKSMKAKDVYAIFEALDESQSGSLRGPSAASSGSNKPVVLEEAVAQSLQRSIQGGRSASNASDIPVPDRKTFYTVVWENTNLQNKQLDCSKSFCVVEFVKEEEEDNADTSKNHVRAVLDANGGSLVPPSMQYLRTSKSFKRFFAEDATRIQHIFSLMAHINEIVQQYNAQAQFADSNLQYQLSAPAKLNFFVDIVHNGSGVKPPLVLWNYYIRFFVYVSLSSTFPIFGFAHPMAGYVGNTNLNEKLEPLVWTSEDEIKGVIGSKLAYASAVWINQRDPPNRYYTDGYALVMEGIYRIETLFRNLEFKPTDDGLPMKDFVAVQELQFKAELSDSSLYPIDFSAYTSISFPVAMVTYCSN